MKTLKFLYASIGFFILALVFVQCQKEELVVEDDVLLVNKSNRPTPDKINNNLSVPVIWSDGVAIDLREPPSYGPYLHDEWWYVWGKEPSDPNDPMGSCRPHPIKTHLCEDGSKPGVGSITITPAVYKAYLQKREENIWQAENRDPDSNPYYIDLLDWADNLETSDWTMNSQVKTELVFYDNLEIPMLQYSMRHVYGWGTGKMYGLKTTLDNQPVLGAGEIATVYSDNVRFTIQKLLVHKDELRPGFLKWIPNEGWTEAQPDAIPLINEPIMNQGVYESSNAPGYFNAEINSDGKVSYLYDWNVRALNEGPGYYRITFSFDDKYGNVALNTFFDENTKIIYPNGGQKTMPAPLKGGKAFLDIDNNLTYMDILIE